MATAVAENPNATGFENAEFILKEVPLKDIRLGKYSLREAERNSEDYQRLRDAIAATNGPMLPILVRVIDDPDNKGKEAYGLIDGLQRFSCCSDLGFTKIPARVIDMDDAEVAAAQIIANHSRINTKPVEYTKQLHRMFNANPTLTLEELADQLHCSVKWLQDRLSLANLHPKIGPLVDEGKIPLAHAFAISKLKPVEEQLAFMEQAQTQGIQEFSGHVSNRKKELQSAARAGREQRPEGYVPVPHMRNLKDIKQQYAQPTVAAQVVEKLGAKTPEDGFKAGIAWVLSMDPDTVAVLEQEDKDRKKAAAEEKERQTKEKLAKRAQDAREAAKAAGVTTDDDNDDDEE